MLLFTQNAVASSLPPLNQPPPSHASAYRSGPQLYARPSPMDNAPPAAQQPYPLPNAAAQPSNATKSPATTELSPNGPVITVFVGNISERAPESMIKKILATVGTVVSWKRVSTFGFCEYE